MRRNFGAETWLYPMPVLIVGTYDETGVPDAMNAAWGGIRDTGQIAVCIDPGHKTAANLVKQKAFTVSIADAGHLAACDYVGIFSGNDVPDKFARAGFHALRSEFVNAPLIAELPMALECRLISFDPESGRTAGEIVNVSADESILDESGKISPEKLRPLVFDPVHHNYLEVGGAAGRAFQAGLALKR